MFLFLLIALFGAAIALISLKVSYRKGVILAMRGAGIVLAVLGILAVVLIQSGQITLPLQ